MPSRRRPDFGDMLTSQVSGSFAPALETVSALAEKYPVYYANGNHEYRVKRIRRGTRTGMSGMQSSCAGREWCSWKMRGVLLPETGIRIFGVEIDMDYYKKLRKSVMKVSYLNSLLGRPCADEYNILLAHNPDYFQAYAGWGADLVLSGHVHGGIMRLPVLEACFPRRCACSPDTMGACMREGKSKMVLGGGWEPTRCQYGYLTREN